MPKQRWIAETLFERDGLRMCYAADKVLYETQTEHQHLVLFENRCFGKMMMLDGAIQVATKDEFIYHEMMTHVPILAHGSARELLIVGGGDCGIAKEALKHRSVRRVTQVEIDASVIEFAKQHFADFTWPVFRDRRFESVIADGMNYVAETQRRFDIIIVDSTDPQGPGAVLFTKPFYRACKRCLAGGGILVTQNGVPMLQPDELKASVRHRRGLFEDATCYVAAIPTYVGGHMAIGYASDEPAHRASSERMVAARYRRAGAFPTRYWTPAVHKAAFALPRFIDDLVAKRP